VQGSEFKYQYHPLKKKRKKRKGRKKKQGHPSKMKELGSRTKTEKTVRHGRE
jgi:hypothetical protein